MTGTFPQKLGLATQNESFLPWTLHKWIWMKWEQKMILPWNEWRRWSNYSRQMQLKNEKPTACKITKFMRISTGQASGLTHSPRSEMPGFSSQVGQINNNVAKGSQPLRRFFGAVPPRRYAAETGSFTRYTFRRKAASIMKIWFWLKIKFTREKTVLYIFG